MSRFASIKTERAAADAAEEPREGTPKVSVRTPGRRGKKALVGYFSPEMSKRLHMLALEQDVSLQALMGEAFDDLMRKYGKHPFGERLAIGGALDGAVAYVDRIQATSRR